LGMSLHDIVFLCDQDDIWLPGKRDAFVSEFARDPKALVVISDAELIDAEGRVFNPSFMATRGGFRGDLLSTLIRNRYLGCAMAVRRELLAVALPIPRAIPMHDMWFGALGTLLGQIRYLPRPFLQYRRHGANVSPSRHQGVWQMLRWRTALLTELFKRLVCARRTKLAPKSIASRRAHGSDGSKPAPDESRGQSGSDSGLHR